MSSGSQQNQGQGFDRGHEQAQNQGHDQARREDGRQQSAFESAERMEQVRQRVVDTTREGLRTGAETLARSGRKVGEEVTRTLGFTGEESERLARDAARNVEAISRSGTTLGLAYSDISRHWFASLGDLYARNMDGLERVARCRSVQELVHVQSQIVRESLEQGFQDGRRITEIASRAVGEASSAIASHHQGASSQHQGA